MVDKSRQKVRLSNRFTVFLLGLSLGLANCGGQPVTKESTNAPATSGAELRWSQTVAPPGIDLSGAQWLKIEAAGGKSNNVQLAAVLRPAGPGPLHLVVWLHGSGGPDAAQVSAAMHLAAGGFVVIVGCWTPSPAEPVVRDGVSVPRIPCLQNYATADDAVRALVEVGQQLPGVKKGAIGLLGVSAGGPQAVQYSLSDPDVGAVVLDSSPTGPRKANVPVLILGGTADSSVSVDEQRTYEQTLRASGSTVESHYYEGGTHAVTVVGDFQEDAINRIIDFYRRHLA